MNELFKSLNFTAYKSANASTRAAMITAAIKAFLDAIADAPPSAGPVAVFFEDRITGVVTPKP